LNFVLLLIRHRRFGWILDPWIAEPFRNNLLKPNLRCTTPDLAEMAENSTNDFREIVSICKSYHDQEILKKFAPKNMTLAAFLAAIPEELLAKHIRPFIDRKLDEILTLARRNQVTVYLLTDEKILTPAMELPFEDQLPEPWFCFSKEPDGTKYLLDIKTGEQSIRLRDPGTAVLTDLPCWLLHHNRLFRFRDGFEGRKITPFLTKDYIQVPLSAEKKFFDLFIRKTLRTGQVKAEGFTIHDLQPEKTMELSLELDWQANPVLVIWFCYGGRKILRGKKQHTFTEMKLEKDEYSFFRFSRDIAWEDRIFLQCQSLGLTVINDSMFVLQESFGIKNIDLYRLVGWVNSNRETLDRIPVTVRQEGLNFYLGTLHHHFSFTSGTDWFDLHALVRFGEFEIPFVQLRHHILDGIREFPLPDGTIAVIPEPWFARYHDLFAFGVISDQKIKLTRKQFSLVASLSVPMDASTRQTLKSLEPPLQIHSPAPPTFRGFLRPYQQEGLAWMKYLRNNGFGGCLADDMGLGKTIQTLALLLEEQQTEHPASLIIMPASLIHNWKNEISRFAPDLRVMVHTGSDRVTATLMFDTVDLVFTTYGVCRNDAEWLSEYRFHYIILDEGQMIRNPDALISKAVMSFSAGHRLVLTGTPIQNSLTDLWSIMEFLNRGMFGPLPEFKRRYLQTPLKDQDKNRSDRLRQWVAPFICRRTKAEVEPDLPDLTTEYRYCEMTSGQAERYELEKSAIRNEILEGIETGQITGTSIQVLRALMRMRQAACHPLLIDRGYQGESGKLSEVMDCLEILREENQKVLIFSSFVEHLKILESRFIESGWKYSKLTGTTVNREEVINEFRRNTDHHFFLISMKAGGVGLNLTEAGYVFILDPWWNLAVEDQAVSRAHRIGQSRKVIVYKFISKDTIEEKILLLQQRKQEIADALIKSTNPLIGMTGKETAALFG
jgi:superfamily II DNA or RNA helicase